MNQSEEIQAIYERLAKLEKKNRRMKQAWILSLLTLICAVGMAQTLQKNRIIEAEKFILKDAKGVIRAKLDATADSVAYLSLARPDGKTAVLLAVNKLPDSSSRFHTSLTMYDADKNLPGISPSLRGDKMELSFSDPLEKALFSRTVLSADSGGSSLSLNDVEGFETVVGTLETIIPTTGGVHKSSAASITMVDKNKKVIWQVP